MLKMLVAVLALAVVRPWGARLPGWLLLGAGWLCGTAVARYGTAGAINGGLAVVVLIEPVDADAARWYVLLWGPVWLVGGLLILASVRQLRVSGPTGPSLSTAGGRSAGDHP